MESTMRIAYWLRWSDDLGAYRALVFAIDEDDLHERVLPKLYDQPRFLTVKFNVEEAK
jgi:hypothetical protein